MQLAGGSSCSGSGNWLFQPLAQRLELLLGDGLEPDNRLRLAAFPGQFAFDSNRLSMPGNSSEKRREFL